MKLHGIEAGDKPLRTLCGRLLSKSRLGSPIGCDICLAALRRAQTPRKHQRSTHYRGPMDGISFCGKRVPVHRIVPLDPSCGSCIAIVEGTCKRKRRA